MLLSLVMPTYEDYEGVWSTIQSFRAANFDKPWLKDTEIVIVDNKPDGEHGRSLYQTWQAWWRGPQPDVAAIRYIPMPRPVGPANAKQKAMEEAKGEIAWCIDSHIVQWNNAADCVLDFFADPAHDRDMLTGPMVYDNMQTISTHFEDQWRGQMWGTWNTDPRGHDPKGQPFEIPANGCGCFAMKRKSWVGFNPLFLGFGGEEWYVHTKVRQHGGKVYCHPGVRWIHRFARPGGYRAPLNAWYKCRNYVVGLTELGIPLDRLYSHFVRGLDEDEKGKPDKPMVINGQRVNPPMDRIGWELLTRNPASPPPWPPDQALPPELLPSGTIPSGIPVMNTSYLPPDTIVAVDLPKDWIVNTWNPAAVNKETCIVQGKSMESLEALYNRAWKTPSDINEHSPKLRELASKSEVVVEFGHRPGVSTVALFAGRPKRFLTCNVVPPDPIIRSLTELRDGMTFQYEQISSLDAAIPPCDLLFIDTVHTEKRLYDELTRHAGNCRRWIAMHDTNIFGRNGEDGGPGLIPAIQKFLKDRPEWFIASHVDNNHGFTVLSRNPEDRPTNPIYLWAPEQGPGTELKAILASLGIKPSDSCDCNGKAMQMDLWGSKGSRDNFNTIVGWLRDGAPRWNWKDKIVAAANAVKTGLASKINPIDPYPGLIEEAIRRAEAKGVK